MQYAILVLTFSLSILSGCAQLPSPPKAPPMSWEARQKQLNAIKKWSIRGKIGIRYHDKGENANLTWHQDKRVYSIELSGPLNMHRVNINGQPGEVTIESSDGQKRTGVSPEYIMQEEFGWTLPFGALLFWVRGLPVPDIESESVIMTPSEQLLSFQQGDWAIEYSSYKTHKNQSLPEKIKLSNPMLSIKLILREWEI